MLFLFMIFLLSLLSSFQLQTGTHIAHYMYVNTDMPLKMSTYYRLPSCKVNFQISTVNLSSRIKSYFRTKIMVNLP